MKRNLDALDALKGIAALAIAFYAWSGFTVWAGSPVIAQFHLFVDFFFVFTGFLLAEVYRDQMKRAADIGKFAILRLARLYPIHLFFLLPLAGIELMKIFYGAMGAPQGGEAAFSAEHLSLAGLIANLTLTQAFGFMATPGWNEPSWYVAIEFWVSLAFATLCLIGVMRSAIGRMLIWGCVIAALCWLIFVVGSMDAQNGGAFARGIYSFGVGVAAQSLIRVEGFERPLAAFRGRFSTLLETPALMVVAVFIANSQGMAAFAAPLVFAGLLFVFVDGRGFVSRTLRTGIFRTLGKFSYSIYMSHFLFILPMRGIFEATGGDDAVRIATYGVGLFLGCTFIFGIITERLVEEPTRDAIRKWLDGQSWTRERERGVEPKAA